MRAVRCLAFAGCALMAVAACAVADHSIAEFPRLAGEMDDAPRFQRAVDACCGGGVLTVPGGDYTLARTVFVTNLCSIEMSAGAYVKAVAEMDWMFRINQMWQFSPKTAPKGVNAERYNLRYIGGTLDADGKASCLAIDNYRHFTLENATFLNGRRYGVGIETEGRGYEMIARNLYFKTLIHGLAGNTGLYTYGGDSHYTDIVVVDYTTGVHFAGRGANRLTRIHVWGGPVKPIKAGELPEMLKNSVCFRIDSSGEILRDCYADTGAIGFWVNGWEERMYGCSYFNNKGFGLKNITILRQDKGTLWCDGCYFRANTEETKLYSGAPDAKVYWGEHGIFPGFWGSNRSAPQMKGPDVQPIDIDQGRQLFLDDVLFAKNTMKRVWHKPVKDPRSPVLKPETPLEKGGKDGRNPAAAPHFGGVWYDGADRLYKCFYNAGWSDGLAYATSKDGITWERPKLQADGGNLVFTEPAGVADITTSVVLDPDALDGQRFKSYAYVPHGARANHAGFVRTSPDGVRWSDPVRMGRCGDASTIFYNPFTRYWCFSLRGWNDEYGRLREFAQADDFLCGARSLSRRNPWLRDVVGGRKKTGEQLYNFDCVAYEGVLIGLAMVMKGPENGHWAKLGEPKDTYLKFGFARNVWDWKFPKPTDGGPFIAGTRRYGDWDMGYVRPSSGVCLVVGDELRFYYGAFAGDRAKADGEESVTRNGMYANGSMGFASLRRDGFCSVQDGEIRTKPLVFSKGDRLWVNADVRQGSLAVRIEGQDGKSFGERRIPAGTDSTRFEVGAVQPNIPFTLVFSSSDGAKLYSFWSGGSDGRSGGYLAGGSPESATLRDVQ